ncbi:MAG: hypothetical protein A2Z83_01010 [Omnitrophica bacterium GWA2_52_8]|nr:MAG: hypothetical protein A2Z83_01010 [Omnitrophica bacterium GWA2_52_8]
MFVRRLSISSLNMRQSAAAKILPLILLAALVCFPGRPAYAGTERITRGVARTLMAPFEIPGAMVRHSRNVIFPLGIVTGAVEGAFKTVIGVVGGAVDIAVGAAPLAKYAVFFI